MQASWSQPTKTCSHHASGLPGDPRADSLTARLPVSAMHRPAQPADNKVQARSSMLQSNQPPTPSHPASPTHLAASKASITPSTATPSSEEQPFGRGPCKRPAQGSSGGQEAGGAGQGQRQCQQWAARVSKAELVARGQ